MGASKNSMSFSANGIAIGGNIANVTLDVSGGTDALALPVGNTAQRSSGSPGQMRFNNQTSQFEGYTVSWGPFGGGQIEIQNNSTIVNTTSILDFSNGTNVLLTVTDDHANGRVNVFIDALNSGGGGGGANVVTVKANDTVVVANAKINFNNTATTTVSAAANGTYESNISFDVNLPAVVGGAYGQANTAYGQANVAYGQANAAFSQANSAYGQANTAYAQANSAYARANALAVYANSGLILSNIPNISIYNTATVNAVVTANGTQGVNVSFSVNTSAVGSGGGSVGGGAPWVQNIFESGNTLTNFSTITGSWTTTGTVITANNPNDSLSSDQWVLKHVKPVPIGEEAVTVSVNVQAWNAGTSSRVGIAFIGGFDTQTNVTTAILQSNGTAGYAQAYFLQPFTKAWGPPTGNAANVVMNTNTAYNFTVVKSGSHMDLFLNNVYIVSSTDANSNIGDVQGYVGLFIAGANATFANFAQYGVNTASFGMGGAGLPIPTNISTPQVLVWNGNTYAPQYFQSSIDFPPVTANTMDDEFSYTGNLNMSLWTLYSSSNSANFNSTFQVANGYFYNTSSVKDLFWFGQNLGGAPSSWTVEWAETMPFGVTGVNQTVSFWVANTVNNKQIDFGNWENGGGLVAMYGNEWSNYVYNSTPLNTAYTYIPFEVYFRQYWQCSYDGTTIYWKRSSTGYPGSFVTMNSQPSATWVGGNPDRVGFLINGGSAITTNPFVFIDFFRRTA